MSLDEQDYINRITLELMVNKSKLKNAIEIENSSQQYLDDRTITVEHFKDIIEITNELILNNDATKDKFSREIVHIFERYTFLCLEHINRNGNTQI